MPRRDYKDRARPRQSKKAAPAWVWMLAGLLVGGLVVGLVWLKLATPKPGSGWVSSPPDHPPRGTPRASDIDKTPPILPPKPPLKFDFFHDLSKTVVVVPDKQLDLRKDSLADASARFEIQLASFKHQADAERLRAKVALLGIETHLGSAQVGAGDTAYRVLAGPYVGRSKLDKVRQLLHANGYDQFLVRILR